jgi:hypothetical protein
VLDAFSQDLAPNLFHSFGSANQRLDHLFGLWPVGGPGDRHDAIRGHDAECVPLGALITGKYRRDMGGQGEVLNGL